MPSESIELLKARLVDRFGKDEVAFWGMDPDYQHGTYFDIKGIPASFSVHTQEGTLAPGFYDIQIEDDPPGDYAYTDVVSLEQFLELVELICGPVENWPLQKWRKSP